MNFTTVTLLICSLLLSASKEVKSFPTGAGGCEGGIAAVGGSHLGLSDGRVVSNNSLETGGVTVQIGNFTLDTNSPLDLATLENHTITIISSQFPIRGILIRVEADGADTSTILTPGPLTKEAIACVAPIVGTTHIDSSDKSELTSVIRFDENLDSVILDITGVFVNSPDGSVYVYSRYLVNFVSSTPQTSEPTAAPTNNEIPTTVPIVASLPTISPVALETESPSTSPVVVETAEPTEAPVDVTSTAPTATPGDVETSRPTTSPILVTDEPTESPLKTPTTTESPVPTSVDKTPEPSLRGGKVNGKGMGMMSKSTDDPSPTKSPRADKKGMMKGMKMSDGGEGKEHKHEMKKSKDEVESLEKKHSMAKISKNVAK